MGSSINIRVKVRLARPQPLVLRAPQAATMTRYHSPILAAHRHRWHLELHRLLLLGLFITSPNILIRFYSNWFLRQFRSLSHSAILNLWHDSIDIWLIWWLVMLVWRLFRMLSIFSNLFFQHDSLEEVCYLILQNCFLLVAFLILAEDGFRLNLRDWARFLMLFLVAWRVHSATLIHLWQPPSGCWRLPFLYLPRHFVLVTVIIIL